MISGKRKEVKKTKEIKSFIWYTDWEAPLSTLSLDELGSVTLALMRYARDGTEPDFTGAVKTAFAFCVSTLQRDKCKYQAKCEKLAANARIGKEKRAGTQMQANAGNCSQTVAIAGDNVNDNDNDNANDNVNVNDNVIYSVNNNNVCVGEKPPDKPAECATAPQTHHEKKPRPASFKPPTIEEVQTYCTERGKGVDPEKWRDYYESNGWRVGKNPMKDWKAAVRNWERSTYQTGRPKAGEEEHDVFLQFMMEEASKHDS